MAFCRSPSGSRSHHRDFQENKAFDLPEPSTAHSKDTRTRAHTHTQKQAPPKKSGTWIPYFLGSLGIENLGMWDVGSSKCGTGVGFVTWGGFEGLEVLANRVARCTSGPLDF